MNVAKAVGKKIVEGDVGIEIECEGRNLPDASFGVWKYTIDNSLRGESAEYVFAKPLAIGAVPAAMKKLNAQFEAYGSKLDFSYRTSVHVHVNVGELEWDELLAFMYAYLLLERPMLKYCGEERIGNRFALRLEDAEGLEEAIGLMIKHAEHGLEYIQQDQYRYASMNIDALKKFGSLEFRGMKGTNDELTVSNWAKALVNLREFACKCGDPKQVYECLTNFGPEEFLQRALGDVAAFFQFAKVEDDIRASFSLTLDIPFQWEATKAQPVYEKVEWLDDLELDIDGEEE